MDLNCVDVFVKVVLGKCYQGAFSLNTCCWKLDRENIYFGFEEY